MPWPRDSRARRSRSWSRTPAARRPVRWRRTPAATSRSSTMAARTISCRRRRRTIVVVLGLTGLVARRDTAVTSSRVPRPARRSRAPALPEPAPDRRRASPRHARRRHDGHAGLRYRQRGRRVVRAARRGRDHEPGIVADGCFGRSLAPGESCSVTVRFSPVAFGTQHATLAVGDATVRRSPGPVATPWRSRRRGDRRRERRSARRRSRVEPISVPAGRVQCDVRARREHDRYAHRAPVTVACTSRGGRVACTTASCIVCSARPCRSRRSSTTRALRDRDGGHRHGHLDLAGSVFPGSTVVTLTASGPVLTGACTGSAPTCTIALGGDGERRRGVLGLQRRTPRRCRDRRAVAPRRGQRPDPARCLGPRSRDATLGKDDKVAGDDLVYTGRFGGGLKFRRERSPVRRDRSLRERHAGHQIRSPREWLLLTGRRDRRPRQQADLLFDDDGDGPRYANSVTTEVSRRADDD